MESEELKNLIIAKIDKLLKQGYQIEKYLEGGNINFAIDRLTMTCFIKYKVLYFIEFRGKLVFDFDLGQNSNKEVFNYIESKYTTDDEIDGDIAYKEAENYLMEELDE